MQFHWEGNSNDDSNVFSDLEDYPSVHVRWRDQGTTRGNGSNGVTKKSDRYEYLPKRGYVKNIADSIDVAHSSKRFGKGGTGMSKSHASHNGRTKLAQLGVDLGVGRRPRSPKNGEVYYTPIESVEHEARSAREVNTNAPRKKVNGKSPSSSPSSKWFPILNFSSLTSTPSDEKQLRGQKLTQTQTRKSPSPPNDGGRASVSKRSKNNTNPFESLTSSSSSPSREIAPRSNTNPFALSRSSSGEKGRNEGGRRSPSPNDVIKDMNGENIPSPKTDSKNPFNSRSASPSASPPRINRGGRNSRNPFNSESKSSSVSPDRQYRSGRSPSRSPSPNRSPGQQRYNTSPYRRSKSRSRSPVIQRPKRPGNMEQQSKFHDLLSCATSPDDPKFLSVLEILVTSRNPRKLAEMKISQAQNWTALHIASLSNPPLFLVYALLMVYPEGARQLDSAGRLPLHLAAGSETHVTVLNTLVRFHHESVCMKDERELIPLHLALLRDRSDEVPVDVLRVLLGQTISSSNNIIQVRGGGNRKVRDGYMRKKEHLNLNLDQIQDGVLGSNRNTVVLESRKRREEMMRRLNRVKTEDHLSRGFTRHIDRVDSEEMHEHLQALWQEGGGSSMGDHFEGMEISEANKFIPEVHHCLKQLSNWKKKYDREHDSSQLKSEEPIPYMNPAAIPAPPYNRLPLHMAVRRNHAKGGKIDTSKKGRLALPPNQNEILRILIHAYPSSLTTCDSQDETPLMACLQLVHRPAMQTVDVEMIELLLGVRTPGFIVAPRWLQDVEFSQKHHDAIDANLRYGIHQSTSGLANNAAMIPCKESLPLHIAARESLSQEIIQAIYTCHPGAKYAQDHRNRTPLHCALQNDIGGNSVDLEMVCTLMDEKVLRIKNNLNQSIFDLLVANAKRGKIPANGKGKLFGGQKATLFRQVFHNTVMEDIVGSPTMGMRADNFFLELKMLPSWLRMQACSTPAVQHLLLQELSKPMNTMLVLLYGIALTTLTIFFGSMMDSIVSPQKNNDITTSYRHQVVILVTNVYLSFNGLCYNFMAFHLHVGIKECISDIWSWFTFFALLLSFSVTVRINRRGATMGEIAFDESLSGMGTIALGLLWISMIGYFSRWWYGISSFSSSISKMARQLIPPLIVLSLTTLSFMQMVYIVHTSNDKNEQCLFEEGNDNGESLQICSLWDAHKIVYLLVIGEGFLGAEASSGGTTIALLLGFFVITFILVLHAISVSILNLQKTGMKTALVECFWAPLLTSVLIVQHARDVLCCTGRKTEGSGIIAFSEDDEYKTARHVQTPCNFASFQQRLANIWDYIIIFAYSDDELKDTKWWYLQRELRPSYLFGKKWFVRFVSVFIIPLWFLLGIITLGILWPPQIRWWIFHLGIDDDTDMTLVGENNLKKDGTASELSNVKNMLYERFQSVQHELQDIRTVLEYNGEIKG